MVFLVVGLVCVVVQRIHTALWWPVYALFFISRVRVRVRVSRPDVFSSSGYRQRCGPYGIYLVFFSSSLACGPVDGSWRMGNVRFLFDTVVSLRAFCLCA